MSKNNFVENDPFTFDELDVVKKSSTPFEFEITDQDGEYSGFFISVYGTNSDEVQAAMLEIGKDKRANDARAALEPESVAENIFNQNLGKRISSIRIAGWRMAGNLSSLSEEQRNRFRGAPFEFVPENALKLCMQNPSIANQVLLKSDQISNFI